MSLPGAGEALALQRRLPFRADPLELYRLLSDHGSRTDTFLLERSVGPTILMDRAAVRAECRGSEVRLTALSAGGRQVLERIRSNSPAEIVASTPDVLVLRFERPSGFDAEERLLAPSPLDALRALSIGLTSLSPEEPFTIACPGICAFDQVDLFEDLPAAAQDPLGFPDFIFWLAESLIVFEEGAAPRVICTAFGAEDEKASERAYFDAAERLAALFDRCQAEPAPRQPSPAVIQAVEVDLDDEAYRGVVKRLREHIAAGEIYQIVPSRTFRVPCPDPLGAYATLRALDPSPYRFFVSGPEHILFGASPETSVRIFEKEGRKIVEVKPIAGTRGRGATADEDDRLEAELRLDHKEAAEHMMLVDLARNDVARVSVSGTRRVEKLMTVERYARVMHLVSSVTGVLRGGLDALHALQACLNVGTLTGAPKHRATQLLRETEVTKRGPYGGAIGWITGEGLMDTGVVIRSAVVKDGTAFVRAGAGIVYDSDPQAEADETRRKASALLSVLAEVGGQR
jgi:anthranilate synthase component 1